MARIRTIKPEFWKHEELSALPEATHLLAAALLNYADDFGYFNANPDLIRAECSPLREPSVSIPESLRSLQSAGYIEIGRCSNGRRYGRVVRFAEHQRVSHPTRSKIASMSITWESSGELPDPLAKPPETLRPEQGTGNREQGKEQGTGKHQSVEPLSRPDDAVFQHWQTTMGHPNAKMDSKRKAKINAALRLGYTAKQLCEAITGYSLSAYHMGQNDSGMRYDQLDLILRDAAKIDQGLKFYSEPPRPRGRADHLEATNRGAVLAFANGDPDPFAMDDSIEGEIVGRGREES